MALWDNIIQQNWDQKDYEVLYRYVAPYKQSFPSFPHSVWDNKQG